MRNLLQSICILLAAMLVPAFADTTVKTIQVEGRGNTRSAAIRDALIQAVQQVNGLTIQAKEQLESAVASLEVTDNGKTVAKATIGESYGNDVATATKGAVRSYRVQSAEQRGNEWVAVLSVDIAQYTAPGVNPNDKRRRIAMIRFGTGSDSFAIGNNRLRAAAVADDILSDFNQYFTQSRRFIVLSRQDNAALDAEISGIRANSPVEEMAKVGQRLGLDFMVAGSVKQLFIAKPVTQTIAISGTTYTTIPRAAIDLDYRIIVPATSQIQWADHIVVDLTKEEIARAQGDVITLYRMLLHAASMRIAQALDNYSPLRALQLLPDGQLVLNQGGSLVRPGAFYDVYKQGAQIVDPVSGASLGRPEIRIATVQITRVDPKLSYAAIVQGTGAVTSEDLSQGVVLRVHRAPVNQAPAPRQPATAPVILLPQDMKP